MKDQNFTESIWEKMGYDAELCPKCNAHLRNGICLNACHLSPRMQKRFSQVMKKLAKDHKKDNPSRKTGAHTHNPAAC